MVSEAAAVLRMRRRICRGELRIALPEMRRRSLNVHQRHGTGHCLSGVGAAMREVVEKKVLSENDRLAAELRQRYRFSKTPAKSILESNTSLCPHAPARVLT